MITMGNTARIAVPSITCPIPLHVNPQAEQAENYLEKWAHHYGLLHSEQAARRFRAHRFGYCNACVYPTSVELTTVAEWPTWLWMFDDQFDDGDLGRRPDQIDGVFPELLGLLPVDLRPTPRPRYGLAAALADFWARIAPPMPPFWRTRFVDHVSDYFESYREETANRHAATPPDLPTYIDLRRRNGATTTCFDLIETCGGFTLSDAIFHSEPFQSLYNAAIDIIGWGNDVMSVDKETARGDVHNLVIVLHHAAGDSWSDAAQRAAEMINQRWQEFFAAEHELSFLPTALAPTERDWANIQRYVSGMKSWLAGIHHWHLHTGRYQQIEYTSKGQTPGYLDKLISLPSQRG